MSTQNAEYGKTIRFYLVDVADITSTANRDFADKKQLEILQFWFGPTCAWDTFVGSAGQDLANEIYEILLKLR